MYACTMCRVHSSMFAVVHFCMFPVSPCNEAPPQTAETTKPRSRRSFVTSCAAALRPRLRQLLRNPQETCFTCQDSGLRRCLEAWVLLRDLGKSLSLT